MKKLSKAMLMLSMFVSCMLTMVMSVSAANPLAELETFGIPWYGIVFVLAIIPLVAMFLPQLGIKLKMGAGVTLVILVAIGLIMSPWTTLVSSPTTTIETDDYTLKITPSAYAGNLTYNDVTEEFTIAIKTNTTGHTITQPDDTTWVNPQANFTIRVLPPSGELYDNALVATIECDSTITEFTSGSTQYDVIAAVSGSTESNLLFSDGTNTDYEEFTTTCVMGSTVTITVVPTLSNECSYISEYSSESFTVEIAGQEYPFSVMVVATTT